MDFNQKMKLEADAIAAAVANGFIRQHKARQMFASNLVEAVEVSADPRLVVGTGTQVDRVFFEGRG